MAIFKRFKKVVSKARKRIHTGAKKFLTSRRKYGWVKKNKVSSMGVAKAMANLSRRLAVSAEYKTLDQSHTSGSPDVTLRQFFRIQASAVSGTPYTTTTPGTPGYLIRQISFPTQGDGATNFDGQKFSVESITWKGTIALQNEAQPDSYIKMYIVQHMDNTDQAFNMSEFLQPDNHGEYSTMSRRGRDEYRDYRVVASRTFKLTTGSKKRTDFNIHAKCKQVIRNIDSNVATGYPSRYYCVAVASPDIADKLTNIDYSGYTRMRFVH